MRQVNEWIAKDDDETIPPRVKLRVFDRTGSNCAICRVPITGWFRANIDHIIALCNGGEHRESNLQLLCVPCHKAKTAADVAEKAKVSRKRKAHLGIKTKSPWRPMPGTKRSGIRKRMNGTVERRE